MADGMKPPPPPPGPLPGLERLDGEGMGIREGLKGSTWGLSGLEVAGAVVALAAEEEVAPGFGLESAGFEG